MARLVQITKNEIGETELPEREAHDRAATLWFGGSKIDGIVVFNDSGAEVARYERPGVVFPEHWPRKNERYVSKDASDLAVPMRFGAGPRAAPPPQAPTGPQCPTCRGPLGVAHEGDEDPTPSGRINLYRCPECGRKLDSTSRVQIERAYLSARQSEPEVITPSPKPKPAPTPPMETGFWRR